MAENFEAKQSAEDAAFVERIASALRAAERAHQSFEKRLMDRVRVEGATLYPVRATSQTS